LFLKGTKTEVAPGVWRLRVYAGRRPNGTPIQITKTVRTGDGRPGSGARAADRTLAKMVAEVDNGKRASGTITVNSSSTSGWSTARPWGARPPRSASTTTSQTRPSVPNSGSSA